MIIFVKMIMSYIIFLKNYFSEKRFFSKEKCKMIKEKRKKRKRNKPIPP